VTLLGCHSHQSRFLFLQSPIIDRSRTPPPIASNQPHPPLHRSAAGIHHDWDTCPCPTFCVDASIVRVGVEDLADSWLACDGGIEELITQLLHTFHPSFLLSCCLLHLKLSLLAFIWNWTCIHTPGTRYHLHFEDLAVDSTIMVVFIENLPRESPLGKGASFAGCIVDPLIYSFITCFRL